MDMWRSSLRRVHRPLLSRHLSNRHQLGLRRDLSGARRLEGSGLAKWAIAGSLILPQSILLGMTFPLITAGVLRLQQPAAGPAPLHAVLLEQPGRCGRRARGGLLPGESGGTAGHPAHRSDAQPAGCSCNRRRDRAGPRLSRPAKQERRRRPASTTLAQSPASLSLERLLSLPRWAPRSPPSSMRSPGSGCWRWWSAAPLIPSS